MVARDSKNISQKEQTQEEFQSTQGVPGYKEKRCILVFCIYVSKIGVYLL
jgi:hypothetical protein